MCSKQIQLARRIWWRSVGVGLFFLPAVLFLLNATPGHAAPRRATDATPTPTPISTDTQCNIQNVGYTFRPNTMLTIRMDTVYNGGNGLTDSGMSYTVKFTGPITLQDPPATTDSNQRVTVAAPSQTGIYHMTCTFNGATTGSGQYAPSTSGVTNVTISQQRSVGGVRLYTNPTTYNPNQSAQMYVVFQAAGGGPTPTGVFNITVGQGVSTGLIAINSQGTALVRLAPTGSAGVGNNIVINYHGDPYYKDSNPSFPITNQPIPGSTPSGSNGGSGGGSGNGSNAKTTPTAALTATVGATPATTATVGTENGSHHDERYRWRRRSVALVGGRRCGVPAIDSGHNAGRSAGGQAETNPASFRRGRAIRPLLSSVSCFSDSPALSAVSRISHTPQRPNWARRVG